MTVPSSWRVIRAQDGRGLLVYFDPYLEDVDVRQLTGPERADRLTRMGSVSALIEIENDCAYDENHSELNGVLQYGVSV